MLEEIALNYSETSAMQQFILRYSIMVIGGCIGVFTSKGSGEIRRVQFFSLTCLVLLGVAFVSFASVFWIVQALAGGFFWVAIASELLALLIAGYLIGLLAAARSRDAFGRKGWGIIAFVPIASLWLLFTPPKDAGSANIVSLPKLLSGGFGVALGLLAIAAFNLLSAYSTDQVTLRVEAASAAGVFDVAMLDRSLLKIAERPMEPTVIDEVTTFMRIEANGHMLTYVYEVDPPVDALPFETRATTLKQNCGHQVFARLIDAGAVVLHSFRRLDGSEIDQIEVTKAACGR